jgi:hypothetical protein
MSTASRTVRAAALLVAALPSLAVGCGAAPPPKEAPKVAAAPHEAALGRAFEAEMADSRAAGPYLDALDGALARPTEPFALATVLAATSALATSGPPTVTELAGMPIAMRSQGGLALVSERLVKAYFSGPSAGVAASPSAPASQAYAPLFARGIVADALHELALFTGDEAAAATWRGRAGCAREAAVVGPLDATPLRSLTGPSPVANGPFPGTFSGNTPFARGLSPVRVKASGCVLSLTSTGALQGTRLVVVDLDSARAQTVGLALTSFSAALLDVGGLSVLSRGFEAGGDPVTRLAAVAVPAGKTRVVVRIANKGEDADLALSAWGEDGGPVPLVAPAAGDTAPGVPSAAKALVLEDALAADASAAQLAAVSLGLMALGEGRDAEHLLEARVNKATRTPTLALLSARAIELADDLPDAKQAAASRVLLDELRSRAPEAWEGALLHARATELQKGSGEGPMRALSELGVLAPAGSAPSIDSPEMPEKEPYSAEAPRPAPSAPDAMTLAFVALLSDRSKLSDVARVAYESLAESAPGAPLLAHVDALLFQRAGQEARAALCHGGLDRSSTNCLHTHAALGDHPAFVSELARLRRLHGSPDHLRVTELDELVRIGELDAALALYDALPPGERQLLSVPAALAAKPSGRAAAKERLLRDRTTSRDAPYGLPGLSWLTRLRPDPALAFEAEGRALVQKDRAQPFLPGAAVAVLRRVESYDLDASGLLHWVVYDLRRVTGTTDVEQGAQSFGPNVEGRTAQRLLRRRIHKRDGRVIEPDAAAHAAQSHADLSQLEQGDYVEQVLEGDALPADSGHFVLDTPDLLPERTSIREATVELALPEALAVSLWSHPLLGAATVRTEAGKTRRSYQLANVAPRRLELGTPRQEQAVALSVGTLRWEDVARSLDENVRSLEDNADPYVTRFAKEAAGDLTTASPELLERLVVAVGKRLRIPGGSELSDVAALYGGGEQTLTARTMIERGAGSRSWVLYRVLSELGVRADIAVAETEPWSAGASFPPHAGRFFHPLVRVSLPSGDVWLDADVDGPPLPPGYVSPELRGRKAMLRDGTLLTVEGALAELGDEVDVRLTVDAQGDARGEFTILLRGRAAQALAQSIETVVGSDRHELFRRVVLGWLPWADVEDVKLSSEEGSWQVALRATIAIHGFARPEGRDGKTWVLPGLEPVHFVFPSPAAMTLAGAYASRAERESALSIETALQYHLRRRIQLPDGAELTRAPEGVSTVGANLRAERRGKVVGTSIEEDFTLSLPTGTVSAEAYPQFLEQLRVVDDGFMAGARVRVGAPPKAKAKP